MCSAARRPPRRPAAQSSSCVPRAGADVTLVTCSERGAAGAGHGGTAGRRPGAVVIGLTACVGSRAGQLESHIFQKSVRNLRAPRWAKMADLDDFFKKKDKKKKGEKKFAMANTDVLAKNLEQMAVKEEKALDKEISEMNNDSPNTPLNQQVSSKSL